ncbi:MAG: hypothetical protein PVJ38_07230 [Candidatus Bathyarchaeota archaeon]
MAGAKQCYPTCRDFNCTKRALRKKGNQGWCEWTNEKCNPNRCTYAACFRRQLLEDGVCGKSIKRRTREDYLPDDLFQDEIKASGKLLRKTGERTIF